MHFTWLDLINLHEALKKQLTKMNLTFQQDKAGRSLLTKMNIYNY